jgi:hypothetical protein
MAAETSRGLFKKSASRPTFLSMVRIPDGNPGSGLPDDETVHGRSTARILSICRCHPRTILAPEPPEVVSEDPVQSWLYTTWQRGGTVADTRRFDGSVRRLD